MDHRANLLVMIRSLLARQWTYEWFADQFWNYYLRRVPAGALSDQDEELFDAIQSQIDFTDEGHHAANLSGNARRYPRDFVDWLQDRMAEYDDGCKLDVEWRS
jgi:hypothetical protein